MQEPKPGIYRHFKGNRYELLGIATHSETMERVVVYRALYGERGLWVRPLAMWNEEVEWEGRIVKRFTPEDAYEDGPDVHDVPQTPESVLKRYYGYDSFRPGQEDVVRQILAGRDVLAIMPTGAGKSLCYQVPAMLFGGVTLVVSPLISLMKDQVQALKQVGIPAAYLNSTLTERQFDLALQNAARGRYKVIYVAPERLLTERFKRFAQGASISMVAVDEAHCISQWGQDFRPSYLDIPDFVELLDRRPVVCAFTATATERVRNEIASLLRLRDPFIQINGFARRNLYLNVVRTSRKEQELMRLLKSYRPFSGIVYCATRKTVEKVHEKLVEAGVSATRYHAGLSEAERRQNQEDFSFERKLVMVATNAFGMGIDKSNVRFIIHYNMPGDIESYYQEAGRAGRDGERADCHLLFSRQDIVTQDFFIKHIGEEGNLTEAQIIEQRRTAKARLSAMVRYCETSDCLQRTILNYFGEAVDADCGFCVNCLAPAALVDVTKEARLALSLVEQLPISCGRGTITDALLGSEDEKMHRLEIDRLLGYGALRGMTRERVTALVDHLVSTDALTTAEITTQNGTFAVLRLGPQADQVLNGETAVRMRAPEKGDGRGKRRERRTMDLGGDFDRDLFDRLSALRRSIANSRSIPPFVVFPDSTLRGLAQMKPRTTEQMANVSGVGVVKLREYGKIFLKEINAYLKENGQ